MKRLLFLIAVVVIAAMPCCAQEPAIDDQAAARGIDMATIERYFAAVLRGQQATYDIDRAVTADELDDIRALVWEAWRRANAAFDEEQLPAVTPLAGEYATKPISGSWKLLPDEQMQFYYGSKGDRPEEGYPLFLCLHGSGDNEREFRVTLAWAQRYDDSPSLYFIPRSPKGGTGCRWYQPTRQQAWERLLRQAYLSGEVNANRVYVFGISEGGYGSQRLASYYADYLAGAGPIAGGEQMFWAPPENCAAIAYCMQTGEEDTMYGRKLLTQRAQEQWAALAAAHPGCYVHKIDLQPGRGHGCDYTITTPWLKTHVRNPWPKYFYWENLPQGGINGEGMAFRKGFYNLYVPERSTDDANDFVRSCYEMQIDDANNVTLDVRVVTVQPDNYITSDQGWAMNIGETKTYEPASQGRVRIYLNEALADLSQPVRIVVNGAERFNGKLTPNLRDLVVSCGAYFDPERLFPVSVELNVE